MQSDPQPSLLGLCLADPKALEYAISRGVTAESFRDHGHQLLFRTMVEAERRGKPTSSAAMGIALPKMRDEIKTLREGAHVAVNASYFVDEVLAQVWQEEASYRLNDLLRLASSRKAYEDVGPTKARIREALDLLLAGADGSKAGPKAIGDVIAVEMEKLEQEILDQRAGKVPGIPTGITALDKLTSGGIKRGSVNVFAARTGMGKTTLALNMAHHAAVSGFSVCYFTVEMPAGQLARKLISLVSAIRATQIMSGLLSEAELDRLQHSVFDLHKRPIWIDDTFRASFESFEFSCRKLKRQGRLDVVVVDYIQQLTISGRFQTKHAVVSEVSHRLKQLAIELDVAVIALAQFNRDAERDGGEPSIWQVKDSGSIEQDADLGVCLFRDDHEQFFLKVDKNRWGRDRVKFLIDADLAVSAFRNASINSEAF